MKKINYKVICDNSKITKSLKKDKKYIDNKLASIIYDRRKVLCYEKSTTNRKY